MDESENCESEKVVSDFCNERLQTLFQNSMSLNNKALGLLAFGGVVLGALIKEGGFIAGPLNISELVFVLSVSAFFISLIFSSLASIPISLDFKPSPRQMYKRIDDTQEELLKLISKNTTEAYEANQDGVNKKAKYLKYSTICILLGLFFLFLWYLTSI